MENVTEALKMAFGVMMFVIALTLGISSFSMARDAVDSIITMKDKKQEYTYIRSTDDTKIVGVETIIPTMYKAYKENFSIEFYKEDGSPLYLYTYTHPNNAGKTDVYYIDLKKELLPDATEAIEHLDILLDKKSNASKYKEQFRSEYTNGLYEFFKNNTFKEELGEYYQEDALAGTKTETLDVNKTKKRLITYTLQ
ncbi:MAG: hypothetical protein HFJ55_04010 [Clostridia bacterium]|jgi:hypothetical protein|nr:hypothetical protein [Clostridia bacterium]